MRVAMKDALSNVDMVGRAKKIGNNTFEYQREDGARVIRLHQTDVAVYDPNDDSWKLNSGGWRTPTTKDRLTNFTPFRVTSDKGVWYVSDGTGRRVPFRDGIVLPREFEDTEKAVEQARGELDLKAKIKKFVTKTVVAGQPLPKPGNGDCWACLMFDQEPPAGENQLMGWIRTPALDRSQSRDTDHLLQHIEEHYMHGSLIVNAFRAAGYRDEGIYIICYSGTPNYARVRSVVSTYLKRRLGLATK